MKYIRTKDGIENVENLFPFEYYDINGELIRNNLDATKIDYKKLFPNNKVADTIEELCDEFVVAYEDGARIVYGDLEWAKVKAKASLVAFGDKSIIYGAIWTDKGLIYVAKMNDKGELELL